MCQTATITRNIIRLSTRSYRQRLEAMTPGAYSHARLLRLNRDLDNFYEFLYGQWQTVTEADYKVFGQQLTVMLDTLKALYNTCKSLPHSIGLSDDTEQLGRNYAALHELQNDIVNFKINAPHDKEMQSLLKTASEAIKRI